MALETLKGVEKIGGFDVLRECPKKVDGSIDWDLFHELRKSTPIYLDDGFNMISFRIQDGPIKENGVNGCQVDTLIEAAKLIIDGLDLKFPCIENKLASHGLQAALWALESRKANREARGVEGTSNG